MIKKIILPLLTILFAFSTNCKSSDCSNAILDDDAQKTLSICLLAGHKTLLDSQTIGSFKRTFGTHDEMTREAVLLMAKAESGDPAFQYLWAMVINHAYLMEFEWVNGSNSPAYLEMGKRQQYWASVSAEGGFIPAMIVEIERYLSPYYMGSSEEKLKMQEYASVLAKNNIPEATEYIAQISSKNSTQDIEKTIKTLSRKYDMLPTDEIKVLAHSLKSGFYFDDSGMSEITKNTKASEELYQYLAEKRNDAESAYFLGKLIGKSDKQRALKYFQLSAERNFPKALGWIGDYQSCIGNNRIAIEYLNRAKSLGYIYADDSLGEIRELGETNNCYDGWIE